MEEMIKIDWPDIKAGDVLMHENGDWLTVKHACPSPDDSRGPVVVHVGYEVFPSGIWRGHGFSPYRKAPELPTQPGAYLDKDGEVVVLKIVEGVLSWHDGNFWQSEADMEHRAPFTRLVPMPTRERVNDLFSKSVVSAGYADAMTDSIISLFSTEEES